MGIEPLDMGSSGARERGFPEVDIHIGEVKREILEHNPEAGTKIFTRSNTSV